MSSFSLFSGCRRELVSASFKTKKMLLTPDDFNSVADYLLFKKYFRRVEDFVESKNYIIAFLTVKVPGKGGGSRPLDRYLIVGEDENGKIVCFYSHRFMAEGWFGFSKDVSGLSEVRIEVNGHTSFRVQGDIVLDVWKIENVREEYLSSLYSFSFTALHSILISETCRRIADVLGELGITSLILDNAVVVEGVPRGFKVEKLVDYVLKNLVFSDIFRGYSVKVDGGIHHGGWFLSFSSPDNAFFAVLSTQLRRRRERELRITVRFENSVRTREEPAHILFMDIVRETGLLDSVEEQESEERRGRHHIYIEKAFPRRLAVDYEFQLSRRRYGIVLSSDSYVTSGTRVKLLHPQHGEKTVVLPASRFNFFHTIVPYRTAVVKNNLLFHHYFS